jgi:hypothetical protein
MSDSDGFEPLSDPDFLAERKRVREPPEALTERYRLINIEFDRRAGVKWASASQGLSCFPVSSRCRRGHRWIAVDTGARGRGRDSRRRSGRDDGGSVLTRSGPVGG